MYFPRSKGNGREIHFKKVKQNKLSLIAEYFGSIHGIFDIPRSISSKTKGDFNINQIGQK